ncbi:MAG: hypothetical protein ACR2P5_05685, partial [Gammaproteobacteria bacterium]
EVDTAEGDESEATGDDGDPEGEKPQEFEVVREGSESHPEKAKKRGKGFKRRTSSLVNQRNEARGKLSDTEKQLQRERDEKKILELRVQQLEGADQPLVEPDPEKFDLGADDPEFIKQDKVFKQESMKREVAEQVKEVTKGFQQDTSVADSAKRLKQAQDKHWDAADAMKAKDYQKKEDKAVEYLGKDIVNHIISLFPGDSHKMVYYLGTNEDEAREIFELASDEKTLPLAVAELGSLKAELKVKPKTQTASDPDEEVEGGGGPSTHQNAQKQLDKLRLAATHGNKKGELGKILAFKKKYRDKGIVLV